MDAKWDERFMAMALAVAQWSKCPRKKVGAVIVDQDKRVLGVGFNGLPRGVPDDEALLDHPESWRLASIHAETNAILSLPFRPSSRSCTIYVTEEPCAQCVGAMIQCGYVREVVINQAADPSSSWNQSVNSGRVLLKQAGLFHRLMHR